MSLLPSCSDMLEIVHTPGFLREYKKLPIGLQEEVKEKIELFKKNPGNPMLKTHKLSGKLKGFFSFSVNYQWRIIFEWDSKKSAALLAVGDHDIYR